MILPALYYTTCIFAPNQGLMNSWVGVGPRSPFIPEIDISAAKFSLDDLSALLLSPSGTLLNLGLVSILHFPSRSYPAGY